MLLAVSDPAAPGERVQKERTARPSNGASSSPDQARHIVLKSRLRRRIGHFDRAQDGTMVVPGECLEVAVTRA